MSFLHAGHVQLMTAGAAAFAIVARVSSVSDCPTQPLRSIIRFPPRTAYDTAHRLIRPWPSSGQQIIDEEIKVGLNNLGCTPFVPNPGRTKMGPSDMRAGQQGGMTPTQELTLTKRPSRRPVHFWTKLLAALTALLSILLLYLPFYNLVDAYFQRSEDKLDTAWKAIQQASDGHKANIGIADALNTLYEAGRDLAKDI